MADRTVNRRPYSVDVSSSEIDYKYFNHVNWKGLCTDKNYFNIDQETFEDCKNVYIDSEGLLKSRPAFKGVEYDFDDTLTECKTFPNHLIVYVGSYTGGYVIRVYKDDVFKASMGVGEKYHLLYDHKLFLFTDVKGKEILYYDDEQEKLISLDYEHVEEHVYVPIKTLISKGVRTENETLSLFTNLYRERYIYTNENKIINPNFVNKNITLIYDNKERELEYVNGIENTIFLPKFSLTKDNWYNAKPSLRFSNDGKVILLYRRKIIEGRVNFSMSYSVDGNIFSSIPDINSTVYGEPFLSKDGSMVVVFTPSGPMAHSIFQDYDGKVFAGWGSLLSHNGIDISALPHIGEGLPDNDETFSCIGGSFISPTNFVVSYGAHPYLYEDKLHYTYMQNISVINDTVTLFGYGHKPSDLDYEINKQSHLIENKPILTDLYFNNLIETWLGSATYFFNNDELDMYHKTLGLVSYHDEKLYTIDNMFLVPNPPGGYEPFFASELIYLGYRDGALRALITSLNDKNCYVTFSHISSALTFRHSPFYYSRLENEAAVIDADGNILTASKYYILEGDLDREIVDTIDLDSQYDYVLAYDFNYAIKNDTVYSNYIGDDLVEVDVLHNSGDVFTAVVPSHSIKSNVWYLSVGNDLYTSSYKEENDKFKLYIPRSTKQPFDYPITNLHPVSESQVAIFFENEIWYTVTSEYGQEYYKSKLNVGLIEGSNVINSIDGKNIIFSSTEGLVYLSYEQLVQSTEQTLTYLSDIIYELYKEYNKDFVKLYLHKYWLYCYNTKSLEFFIFDIRNNSWWKWEYRYPIMNIIVIDNDLRFINDAGGNSNTIVNLSNDINEYYDYGNWDDEEHKIDWFFTSQKLHLSSLNYYKNIASIIINNVEPENIEENVSYNLNVKNYRLSISDRYEDVKTMDYVVNMLRTYVKRCNSRKVNQFQYTISSNDENAIQLPLSIHSIIVKYSMGGHVR